MRHVAALELTSVAEVSNLVLDGCTPDKEANDSKLLEIGRGFSLQDKEYLERFTNLEMLCLSDCSLSSLQNLPHLPHLLRLELSFNKIGS